jgi:hypothetical protein
MDPISDDTGVPAPQVQDLLEKVEIDETVAACKYSTAWVQERERLGVSSGWAFS